MRIANAILLFALPLAAGEDLVPFVLPWDDASAGPAGLTVPDAEAERVPGRVTVSPDGHLQVESRGAQKRFRIVGVNFCAGRCFPAAPEEAAAVAGRLAKFGVNCVRFHHMDSSWANPSIFLKDSPGRLDPVALGKLASWVSALRARGIYSNLNLLVGRPFRESEGLPAGMDRLDWKDQQVAAFFLPRLIELQKDYARQLLTFKTGAGTFAEDPAVAIVEIMNENGLVHGWLSGVPGRFPPAVIEELQKRWNAWLKQTYRSQAEIDRAWGVRAEALGEEMLGNSDFLFGADGWNLEQHFGARAASGTEKGADGVCAVTVRVTEPGKEGWHVQFGQAGIAVRKGAIYTLRVKVRADAPAGLWMMVGMAHEPWRDLGFGAALQIGPEWVEREFSFVATADDAEARVLMSGLGQRKGAVTFARISLRPGGKGGGDTSGFGAGTIPLPQAEERARLAEGLVRDAFRFLRETERDYWREMRRFLREELKTRALLVGTILANSPASVQAEFDAVDSHAYWQHPEFPGTPWDQGNWTVGNKSLVNEPAGPPAAIAMQAVEGKPHLVTEYNHPSPNLFSAEAPLLLSMVASLQGWDGIFFFDYGDQGISWDAGRIGSFFDISRHPAKMVNLLVASRWFRDGRIAEAKETVLVGPATEEAELDVLRQRAQPWRLFDAGLLGVRTETALVHRVRLAAGGAKSAVPPGEIRRFASDNGELVWDLSSGPGGVVTLNAPSAKAAVGYWQGRTLDLGGIEAKAGEARGGWCALAFLQTKGETLRKPGRALIAVTGAVENTGMGWKNPEKTTVGRDWGGAPTLVEIVPMLLRFERPAARMKIWALDERGARGRELPVRNVDGKDEVRLGPPEKTLWYEAEWN